MGVREGAREGKGEGAISRGNPVLVMERYWLSTWRCFMLSQRGRSASIDRAGSRYRSLGLNLAGQCRMASSKVSSSVRQRGQEVSWS